MHCIRSGPRPRRVKGEGEGGGGDRSIMRRRMDRSFIPAVFPSPLYTLPDSRVSRGVSPHHGFCLCFGCGARLGCGAPGKRSGWRSRGRGLSGLQLCRAWGGLRLWGFGLGTTGLGTTSYLCFWDLKTLRLWALGTLDFPLSQRVGRMYALTVEFKGSR